MVPTAARFERLLGGLGVSNRDRVVFYDQKGIYSSARAWWLMHLFGHERCAVLDGGLPKWRSEGRPIERGEAPEIAPARYLASLEVRHLRGLGDVRENLRTRREMVLDARSTERFYGRVPEPRPGVRSGHIPGSRSLPYTELLTAQQTLRSPAELLERFSACGVSADVSVISSCGSGLTAAVINLALAVAGLVCRARCTTAPGPNGAVAPTCRSSCNAARAAFLQRYAQHDRSTVVRLILLWR